MTPDERQWYTDRRLGSPSPSPASDDGAADPDSADACFTRVDPTQPAFSPLGCVGGLRGIVASVRTSRGRVDDEVVCDAYAPLLGEQPLLLSGTQVELSRAAIERRDVHTELHLVILGLSGVRSVADWHASVDGSWMGAEEPIALDWARGFLERQGRDLSAGAIAARLRGGPFVAAEALAWPACTRGRQQAWAQGRSNPDAWPKLRRASFPAGDGTAGILCHQLARGPGPAAEVTLAELLSNAGAVDDAASILGPVLARVEDPAALNLAGQIALGAGRPEEGLAYFQRGLAAGREDGWPQYNAARCLEALGRLDEAAASYAAATADTVKALSRRARHLPQRLRVVRRDPVPGPRPGACGPGRRAEGGQPDT